MDGVLLNVSPIRIKCFVRELVDEKTAIPIVGFDHSKQQQPLSISKSPTKKVKLTNCDLQLNKFSKKNAFGGSSRDFDVKDTATVGTITISMSQLPSMEDGDIVNVRVKVKDKKKTGKNLTKQEVTVADSTDNTTLTLWENDIDSLQLAESYYLTKLNVRIYYGDYSLSLPKFGATVTSIEDICDVIALEHGISFS